MTFKSIKKTWLNPCEHVKEDALECKQGCRAGLAMIQEEVQCDCGEKLAGLTIHPFMKMEGIVLLESEKQKHSELHDLAFKIGRILGINKK